MTFSADDAAVAPLAAVFGCAGERLSEDERRFFSDADPYGFILFRRNCVEPAQVRALVAELRDAVGRAAPVLIDQEGGRVARLGPPHWRAAPPQGLFARLAAADIDRAAEAARRNAQLIALELAGLGIDVDCLPVLDVPAAGAHDIIGDRALGRAPEIVATLGRAVCDGLLAGGVLPVIKHVPGHGRATADSHESLPRVDASADELRTVDFPPFESLAGMPWAMTAHVVYEALDPTAPATTSSKVVGEVIRGEIGFDGLLVSDDINMEALAGTMVEKTHAVLAAGCDLVLHCSGDFAEMREVAEAATAMTPPALVRHAKAERFRERAEDLDAAAVRAAYDELTQGFSTEA